MTAWPEAQARRPALPFPCYANQWALHSSASRPLCICRLRPLTNCPTSRPSLRSRSSCPPYRARPPPRSPPPCPFVIDRLVLLLVLLILPFPLFHSSLRSCSSCLPIKTIVVFLVMVLILFLVLVPLVIVIFLLSVPLVFLPLLFLVSLLVSLRYSSSCPPI